MEEFINEVKQMRTAQKRYVTTGERQDLRVAQTLETRVDNIIRQYEKV